MSPIAFPTFLYYVPKMVNWMGQRVQGDKEQNWCGWTLSDIIHMSQNFENYLLSPF